MRLKPTKVAVIYADGLVELDGFLFDVGGREMVVHKERPQLYVLGGSYMDYLVSSIHGFGVAIGPTRSRLVAVSFANEEVSKISDKDWAERCRVADQLRKQLKVVEG